MGAQPAATFADDRPEWEQFADRDAQPAPPAPPAQPAPMAPPAASSTPSRPMQIGGYFENARENARPGRVALTLGETRVVIEGLLGIVHDPVRAANAVRRRSGHSVSPEYMKQVANALVGLFVHGVIYDHPDVLAFRLQHGASTDNVKPCRKSSRRASP